MYYRDVELAGPQQLRVLLLAKYGFDGMIVWLSFSERTTQFAGAQKGHLYSAKRITDCPAKLSIGPGSLIQLDVIDRCITL